MDFFGNAAPFVWFAIVAFGIILAIAWIVLPFALFGTKPLLRELIMKSGAPTPCWSNAAYLDRG